VGLPLSSEALIVDAGGYEGDWTADLSWRYASKSIVFEPIPTFARALTTRFEKNDRVRVVAAGLGSSDRDMSMFVSGDSSSAFRGAGDQITVPIWSVDRLWSELGAGEVGCMKLNIEGGEYEVIERLHETKKLASVRSFLIQFHVIDASSQRERERRRSMLAETHRCLFDYPFVWERWDLKD
jgi:FkbM family methyltransferase